MSISTKKPGGSKAAKLPPPTFPDTPEGRMEAALYRVRESLGVYQEGVACIAEWGASKTKLEKEVKDYLDSVDPTDAEAVGIVRVKQDQIQLIPRRIEREEERQSERGDAFVLELEEAAKSILDCANVEVGGALDRITAAISPWFPSYLLPADRLQGLPERTFDAARHHASQSALLGGSLHGELTGPLNWQRPQTSRLYGNAANVASYDRTLIERAKQLFRVYQAWQDNGRSFMRHKLPAQS